MNSAAANEAQDESGSMTPIRVLGGKHLLAEYVDSHQRICDLMQFDFPVLSLYSDGRRDWLYLWCDTNGRGTDRWLIFPTSRDSLVGYLKRTVTLRSVVEGASSLYLLDTTPTTVRRKNEDPTKTLRRTLWSVTLDKIAEYMPTADSYFEKSMTNEVDITEQLAPEEFRVPIDGTWFGQDFQDLFRSYERIYALYYATGKRFVTNINNSLTEVLKAPWEGGFSRVNLYTRLAKHIPGIHSLKVGRVKFASPGDIYFDAVESVGKRIQATTIRMIQNEEAIDVEVKRIRKALRGAGVNRKNLSDVSDKDLRISQMHLGALTDACEVIATALDSTSELMVMRKHAPNIVVHSKALLSFVGQLKLLAQMQREQMLTFSEKLG
jgi:hypothetical protein